MAESRNAHLLEGDGIISNLYYYLWRKSVAEAVSMLGGGGPGAGSSLPPSEYSLPSTVIFEHNFPKAWYFHSPQTLEIERKLGKDVDSHQILEEFTKRPTTHQHRKGDTRPGMGGSTSGGAAAIVEDAGDIVATYYSLSEDELGQPCTKVEYLDKERLETFLLRRARRPDGFLQKWVLSSGKHNTVVQAIWSPHVCIVSKRQNCLPIRDRTKPLYDRAVTFEGPTHHSVEAFVAPHIKWQVKCICEDLVEHLLRTQKIPITRMVLYFKVDNQSNMWLLYCSSLRVTDRVQLNLTPIYVKEGVNEEEKERLSQERIAKLLRETFDDEPLDVEMGLGREGGKKSWEPTKPTHPSRVPGIRRPTASARNPRPILHKAPRGAFGHVLDRLPWPEPPKMGPVGDAFSLYPDWKAHAAAATDERLPKYSINGRRIPKDADPYPTRNFRRRLSDRESGAGALPSDGASSTSNPKTARGTEDEEAARLNSGSGDSQFFSRAMESPPLEFHRASSRGGNSESGEGDALLRRPSSASKTQGSQLNLKSGRGKAHHQHHHPNHPTAAETPDSKHTHSAGWKRTPKLLWDIVRLAVRTGYLLARSRQRELKDWATSFQYCLYSHFLTKSVHASPNRRGHGSLGSAKPLYLDGGALTLQIPASVDQLFHLDSSQLPPGSSMPNGSSPTTLEEWLTRAGLRLRVEKETPSSQTQHGEPSPTDAESERQVASPQRRSAGKDDHSQTRSLTVEGMRTTVVEFQSLLQGLISTKVSRPFASLWWWFVALKWIQLRRHIRASSQESAVKGKQ